MAITVEEINSVVFDRSKKGYNAEQVDKFIDRIAGELDSLQKENRQLRTENDSQRALIESYKSRENAIEQSLLEASNLRREIIDKANRDAQDIIRESGQATEIQKNRVVLLKQEEEQTIKRIRYILEAQLANLEYLIKEG